MSHSHRARHNEPVFRYTGPWQDPTIRMSQSERLGVSLGISHCAPSSFLIQLVFHLYTTYSFRTFDRLNPWWANTHRHNADPLPCSDYCGRPGSLDGCLGLPGPGRQLRVSTDFGEAHRTQYYGPLLTPYPQAAVAAVAVPALAAPVDDEAKIVSLYMIDSDVMLY